MQIAANNWRKQEDIKKEASLSDYVFGKVPPNALPLEEAVLGAIMLDRNAMAVVLEILKVESYYANAHQLIYQAMIALFNRSQPIDMLTVMEELKKRNDLENAGGPGYLAALTNKVASAANIEYHARIIAQKYILRELIRSSTQNIRDAFEETMDVFDVLGNAEKAIYDIHTGQTRTYQALSTFAMYALQYGQKKEKGIYTGFRELDALTGGLQPTDLICIAARPGMGKTAMALSLARNVAKQGKGVAIFSLEMSNEQLAIRLNSIEAGVNSNLIRDQKASPDENTRWIDAAEKMADWLIYTDDTPAISTLELRAKCRRLKAHHNIELVIIDYLQLMSSDPNRSQMNRNREQEVSEIARALKALAKELKIPVVALSQLSRSVETRGGSKRPQLSDRRESGSIEQECDVVAFIYRAEYYGITEDPDGGSLKGVAEIIVAKHRNGALKDVRLKYEPWYTRFSDPEEDLILALSSMPNNNQDDPIISVRHTSNTDEDLPF